jgi:hypothetical protein
MGAMKKVELGKKVHISAFVLKGLELLECPKCPFSDVDDTIE